MLARLQELNKKYIKGRIAVLPPAARLAVVVGVTASAVFLITRLTSGSSGGEFQPVYSQLSLEDAGLVAEHLKSLDIPYRLGESGSSILVPAGRVVEARIALAQDGLPRNARTGLGLLEGAALGETQVVIDAKLLRAKEQEIESTLMRFLEIKDARVHLAIAPDVLFEDDRVPSTASVMLTLLPGGRLKAERVDAVRTVVAAAVSGLNPDQVTITDSLGTLLARAGEGDDPRAIGDRRLELQRDVEDYLTEKTRKLLGTALGSNRATIAINATLDFDTIERENVTYDPDRSSVRSEERTEQSSPGDGSSSEKSITNYDLNSRMERVVRAPGSVERLTAAIYVEGTYKEGEDGPLYVPQTAEELDKIRAMVCSAIGFVNERGDEVTVADRRFDRSEEDARQAALVAAQRNQLLYEIGLRLIVLAGIIGAYYPVKRLLRLIPHVDAAFVNRETDPEARQKEEEHLISEDEERRRQVHSEVTELAIDSPENVAQLVRTWLAEVPAGIGKD